ncbi:hypothetical protein WA026_014356 [Henosepilachna vigintioctopunctata]|uniref:ascorbate ferrireductase (transmembrane) n=1 Tax=Henosepilachna vigintioctopunctata TaxID=420089 RepID=A0AAW1UKI0_9CUCU
MQDAHVNTRESNNNHCTNVVTSSVITNIVHVINITFVILIVYLSLCGDFVFFTWHPILLSVGWMVFSTEGILTLNKNNNILKKLTEPNRILLHWILQTIALISITLGFLIALKSKNDKNKSHFKTWHALFGLLGVIFAILSGLNGISALYSNALKNLYSPKLNKFIHVLSGTLAYLFGGISGILSVYSKWFGRKTANNSIIFGVSLILVSIVVIWTLIKPVKSVCDRFRNLISV